MRPSLSTWLPWRDEKFASPSVMIAPLNVMEIGIRPLSLCFRLFGNILGAYIIMELIKIVCPLVLPIPFSLYFDIFDGILQPWCSYF